MEQDSKEEHAILVSMELLYCTSLIPPLADAAIMSFFPLRFYFLSVAARSFAYISN
jgi:hypothetical protein